MTAIARKPAVVALPLVKPGWQRRAVAYGLGIAIAAAGLTAFRTHYWIGLDLQQWRCMPWIVYLVERAEAPIERHGYYHVEARGLAPFFRDGARFAKRLVGLPGDHVQIHDGEVRVNEVHYGHLNYLILAKLQKPYTAFETDIVLGPDQYWLMGTTTSSYDSRYWGPARRDQIKGEVHPIW